MGTRLAGVLVEVRSSEPPRKIYALVPRALGWPSLQGRPPASSVDNRTPDGHLPIVSTNGDPPVNAAKCEFSLTSWNSTPHRIKFPLRYPIQTGDTCQQ